MSYLCIAWSVKVLKAHVESGNACISKQYKQPLKLKCDQLHQHDEWK
uniref:Uncharacterized protein n=1 Tax=Anguilla anguilla TaxID=7936 RepID=A0A0E9X1Q9_ANGAN